MKQQKIKQHVIQLAALGERQFSAEAKAAQYIVMQLRKNGLKPKIELFETEIPQAKGRLLVDGKSVPFLSNSFIGGKLTKVKIIDILSNKKKITFPNISYSPKCVEISPADFYFAPSFCVSHKTLRKIKIAKVVSGEIKVKNIRSKSKNILIGNSKNPRAIIFCHYDSWGPGAIDDASGVAINLQIIIENKQLLADNLFVFAGNEEISIDKPFYWGHGYRIFEQKYYRQMKKTKKIIIVDGIGNSMLNRSTSGEIIHLAFPIKHIKTISKKTIAFHSDLEEMYRVYHSILDTPAKLRESRLRAALSQIMAELS